MYQPRIPVIRTNYVRRLYKYVAVLAVLVIGFFLFQSELQPIEIKFFHTLNATLNYSFSWQYFWGYLNHPSESWLNVVVMVAINIIAILYTPAKFRTKNIKLSLFFWFMFQFVILFNSLLFSKVLDLHRLSPSLVGYPIVWLSESLNIPGIKDASYNSFPAGHALVAVYWLSFMTFMQVKVTWLRILSILVAALIILPRLFSGAHWLSDMVFSYFYAKIWFCIFSIIIFTYRPDLLERDSEL